MARLSMEDLGKRADGKRIVNDGRTWTPAAFINIPSTHNYDAEQGFHISILWQQGGWVTWVISLSGQYCHGPWWWRHCISVYPKEIVVGMAINLIKKEHTKAGKRCQDSSHTSDRLPRSIC